MRFAFVFGVGRSGTTLLSRLLACTTTPVRLVNELCPGIPDRIPHPVFMAEPEDEATALRVREALALLAAGKTPFAPAQASRIERDDADARTVLVKDVHSLLAWPAILDGLADWRAVVITRDPLRALDSYLHGHPRGQRRYLVEEYAYLARLLRRPGSRAPDPRVAKIAADLPRTMRSYLRRPRALTREVPRQAVATGFLARFLATWADEDERVAHLGFESLCRDPLGEASRLLDFLELDADDRTLQGIQEMTSGSSAAYYATDKDSRRVLEQPYKVLHPRQRHALSRLLGGD